MRGKPPRPAPVSGGASARVLWSVAMSRAFVAAIAAIALLVGGSIGLIVWLTEPTETGSRVAATVPEPADDPGDELPAAPLPPAAEAAPSPGQPFAPPVEATPAVADPEPEAPALDGLSLPPPLDLRPRAAELEALVSRRCGKLTLQAPYDPGDAPRAGRAAVLLVTVQGRTGGARIVDSEVHSAGTMLRSMLACARWALRDQPVSAPGLEPGRKLKVPVVLGLDAAE
jgi:hypothetical protein